MAAHQPGEPISRAHLTASSMVGGNEDHIEKVVLDGKVMEWVGIGWIDATDLTDAKELERLPVVA